MNLRGRIDERRFLIIAADDCFSKVIMDHPARNNSGSLVYDLLFSKQLLKITVDIMTFTVSV